MKPYTTNAGKRLHAWGTTRGFACCKVCFILRAGHNKRFYAWSKDGGESWKKLRSTPQCVGVPLVQAYDYDDTLGLVRS